MIILKGLRGRLLQAALLPDFGRVLAHFAFEIRPIHKTAGVNAGPGEMKLDFSGMTTYLDSHC
jgi:hypothetical protein